MDNNYYNNSNNSNNNNSNSNYNNNNSNNNSSNQYSDSFYSYNNQQNHGNQNNTQNDSTAFQAGGYGSTQSSIYGGQNNSHGSGYGTTQNNSQSTNYGSTQNYNQSAGYESIRNNSQSTGYGTNPNNSQSAGYGSTRNNSQSYGYGNQNGSYGTYGSNTGYQSNGANGTAYGSNPKPEKKKKERKPGGFGKQLAKCAALALVFGLVAGGVMTGVNYASGKIFGTTNASNVQASLTTGDDSTVQPTAISSSYVATDVSDIVDEVMPSIVAITNVSQTEYQSFWGQSKTYESTSCGSGIIVSQDNEYLYVATNNHVVEGANSLTVTFANDDTVSAEIKGTDPSTDLAVVKVALSSIKDDTMSEIKVATLGSSDTLKVGESCIAIGNALGYGQSVTTGVISALNREVSVSDSSSSTNYTAELIQTDAAINPGNSGGALLNTAGEVIGINSVKYSDTSVEGIGYAIPMDTAKPIIEELITKEKVDESNSAYLGIVGVDVTSDVAKTYNMPTGVYVAQVMEGAAAEQAGIQKGDIITKFDGKDVTSMEELSYNMQYYAAGTTVDVVIERSSNGQYEEQTISVTLGKKN
ncbi:S1C family serine protease [Roseburia inulinivorans]|uniref:Putative serine protease HhoB n=1 Tax=Roseburia inulinivorans TaxID=360807 RepID=A0A173YSW6_9FIRM|nr:trypsin-like peptidase domain-containing protein [Roseburia inulinivorans]CUN67014.1 Putative serine protease HhoB precursor [Roseburia inulinivorans]